MRLQKGKKKHTDVFTDKLGSKEVWKVMNALALKCAVLQL